MASPSAIVPELTLGRILRLWWPLAASWLCMGAELPIFTAFVARLPESEVHLAAYGSLVFPIALLVEAPVIMLLAASTALCVDRPSTARVHRFMMLSGAALTLIHLVLCVTPLYGFVARSLLGVPPEVVGPARLGLTIMLPWTWAIAHRRFHQGLLIRAERSREIGLGTLVRVLTLTLTLAVAAGTTRWPGIAVGTTGVALAVCVEAVFVRWRVGPLLRTLPERDPDRAPLTTRSFLHFYLPLALTPLLTLLNQPLGSAAMSRMPRALASLAAWPPVHGFVFLPRSLGFAFNEVVVALLHQPGAAPALRRFCALIAGGTVTLLVLAAVTPFADLWFSSLQGLSPELAGLAGGGLLFAALLPGFQALQSWYQGVLVHARRTRGVTEAVGVYVTVCAALLWLGTRWKPLAGIHFTLLAFTLGAAVQTLWLARRCARLTPDPACGPDDPASEGSGEAQPGVS